jgi:hypothetical protein
MVELLTVWADIYILDSGSPSRDNDVRVPWLEKAMG